MSRVLAALRRRFVAGLLVMVPFIATVAALRFLLAFLDGILGPLVTAALGREVPGLGALATIAVVFLVGALATNFVGGRLVAAFERAIGELPVARGIYRAARQIVATATVSRRQAFSDVVLVEYPRKGLHSYGFVTSYTRRPSGDGPERLANVFIPGPPVPTTGLLIVVPEDELVYLDISVEDALKLVLSLGLVAPPELRPRPAPHTDAAPPSRAPNQPPAK